MSTASGPKRAVIVVGPVGSSTDEYIAYARAIGDSLAQSPDIHVKLILPPHATWDVVVDAANGADFFAYVGHGNGWPSPMPPAQEDGKDGLGLNPTDGDTNNYHVKYYGANFLRGGTLCSTGVPNPATKEECTAGGGTWKNYGPGIRLAPNAIVLLNHLCYSAGNASPGMALPSQEVAFQRVDNFASSFLAIGARAVYALAWQPGEDLTDALINKHMTVDSFFEWKDGEGTDPRIQPWHGWIGWKPDVYLDSVRTPGAVVHLDPHPTEGHLRAVTGDLGFTFDEWWAGAAAEDTTPPEVTSLSAGPVAGVIPAEAQALPVFTPNADGLADRLTIQHTLSEPAYLDATIAAVDPLADPALAPQVLRSFTSYSSEGAASDTWDGTDDAGAVVPDGTYTITVTPRDRAGNVGLPVATQAMVLTAMRAPSVGLGLFNPADGDALAQSIASSVTLTRTATVSWSITDGNGETVKTAMLDEPHDAGSLGWDWDGRDDAGAYVPNGTYWSQVTAVTEIGAYSHRLPVQVMPFRISVGKKAARGRTLKIVILAAEAQQGWPKMTVKQPGKKPYTVGLLKSSGTQFRISFIVKAGGPAGTLTITFRGTDTNGGVDSQTVRLQLL
jgi:hypothetical protein